MKLNFICTHNSRRSHISQFLVFASFYHILGEKANRFAFYSGGTEATAFHLNSIRALREFGFSIEPVFLSQLRTEPFLHFPKDSLNPVYEVRISPGLPVLYAFSKKYTEPPNPQKDYLAIMTCDHAAKNCPVVYGAWKKFNLTYRDPKEADGTPAEEQVYRDKVKEIGREMLFLAQMV